MLKSITKNKVLLIIGLSIFLALLFRVCLPDLMALGIQMVQTLYRYRRYGKCAAL